MFRSTPFFALALLSVVACSSTTNPDTAADSGGGGGGETSMGVDTGSTVDTGSKVDTGKIDSATMPCDQDLPADYKCPDFKVIPAKTTCTEAMLQELLTKCIKVDAMGGLAVPADCAGWKTAHPDCNVCVEGWSFDKGKVYPDDYQCYDHISPGCGKPLACELDCGDTVCSTCDMATSEYQTCVDNSLKMGGRCYNLSAKAGEVCRADMKNAACDVTQYYTSMPDVDKLKAEVLRVLRGACRDNGDWSKADTAGGDAGVSDAGMTDVGAGG